MLYGLILTFYILLSLFLAFIILLQKGKSGTGFGAFSAGTQMFFGGSGGQDILEKATWVTATLFLASSLFLSLYTTRIARDFSYVTTSQKNAPALPVATASETTSAQTQDLTATTTVQ